jgi:AcrR family transcriptional regulator
VNQNDPATAAGQPRPPAARKPAAVVPNRRARRRQETITEILDIAVQVMTEEGAGGLTIAEIARRLGVQAPSIYKYFPSLMSIYDELFRRGQTDHLRALRAAAAAASPGMATVHAVAEAAGRWAAGNMALAQLLFWRPIPRFAPSTQAFEPSREMFQLFRGALASAVSSGELGPDASTSAGVDLLSALVAGVMSQYMANEPGTPWGSGRFTPLLPRLIDLLRCAYPPQSASRND